MSLPCIVVAEFVYLLLPQLFELILKAQQTKRTNLKQDIAALKCIRETFLLTELQVYVL